MNFQREDMLHQGITWDYAYESGNDIRRDPFHEHFLRESMHPYHYLMYYWERHPSSKVDTHLIGFEAPDYLRERTRKRPYAAVKSKIDTFWLTHKNNYDAENTNYMFFGIGSPIPLDLLYVNNLFLRSAWNRYFFNEQVYITPESERKDSDFKVYNFEDPKEKQNAAAMLKKLNKMMPGFILPEGEEEDFEKKLDEWYAANRETLTNKETTKDKLI